MGAYSLSAKMLNNTIPVSRFNNGEAGRIFDEVGKTGIGLVIKNSKPACVLLSISEYERMMEEMEDFYLAREAEKRLSDGGPYHSFESVLAKHGMTIADIEAMEDVEID